MSPLSVIGSGGFSWLVAQDSKLHLLDLPACTLEEDTDTHKRRKVTNIATRMTGDAQRLP
jgi:hypothetical protein